MAIKHTEDFKQEAVRIALTSGLPRRRAASDLRVGTLLIQLFGTAKSQKQSLTKKQAICSVV